MAKTPETAETHCPFHAERSGEVREVGGQAVWSLSSCKPGSNNGILKKLHNFIIFYFY